MNELVKPNTHALPGTVEQVLVQGDLSKLDPSGRLAYYKAVCDSIGLNPLTKPFEYITLNGKLTLYARKDCTDQLRNLHSISITIPSRELIGDVYVITARANRPDGRIDEATGAVPLEGLKGEAKANAMMKCETKAKRRVTLSICGLGLLDESEIESIPDAKPYSEPVAKVIERSEPAHDSAPAEVQEMYRIMAAEKAQGFAKVFALLQDQMISILGQTRGIEAYNLVLGHHGVDTWQSFKSLQKAKQCVLSLHNKITELQSDIEPSGELFAEELATA